MKQRKTKNEKGKKKKFGKLQQDLIYNKGKKKINSEMRNVK
jgi:hypothetical protein